MYNGTTEVFSIKSGQLKMNGNGTFSGDISGASGTIGGWKYDSYGITATPEAIYNSGITYQYRLTAKGIEDIRSNY
jgi:hypothetical protein